MHELKSTIVCDNCEEQSAKWQCQSCANQNQFCDGCKDLHTKVKAFRSHTIFNEIVEKHRSVICSNCEKTMAKFMCLQCRDENERYFCLGCSLFHNKIKAFRNHSLTSINNDANGTFSSNRNNVFFEFLGPLIDEVKTHMERLTVFVQDLMDGKANISFALKVALTLIGVFVFLLCKYLFGSSSLVVNMGAVAGIYFYLQKRKEQQLIEKQNLLQSNLFSTQGHSSVSRVKQNTEENVRKRPTNQKISFDEMKSEFPNEFPYELHGKPASLRKRGRPYQPRPVITKTMSDSPF